jgi:hypothetical protein
MTHVLRRFASAIALTLLIASPALAQNFPIGRPGVSASLQQGQLDVLVPYHASESIVVVPGVRYVNVEDGGTDLGVGVALRLAWGPYPASAYIGPRVAVLLHIRWR